MVKICFVLLLFAVAHQSSGETLVPVNPQDGIYQEPRIMYGYTAKLGQFPHMCYILNRHATKLTLCGGSIISTNLILTAAHCVKDVLSGTVGCGTVDRTRPSIQVVTDQYKYHENYNPSNLNNDVAVWTLPISLIYSAYVQPIRLPTLVQMNDAMANRQSEVSGFGRYSLTTTSSSQILRWVYVRTIPNAECALNYGTVTIQNFSICALGYEHDEQGTCFGDSGGPLIIKEGTVYTQIGIVSFVSSKGCGTTRPTGYVRVSHYVSWINKNFGLPIRT